MAKLTSYTYLMVDRGSGYEKLVDITQYPDLGGDTNKIDVTTLSDKKKRTINGIEDSSDLTFSAWYELDAYEEILELEESDTVYSWQLWFGEDGDDGIFEWEGKIHVYPTSGDVDNARGMDFSISDEGEEPMHLVV